MKQEKNKKTQKDKTEVSNTYQSLGSRGRIFEGTVTKKFDKRVVVEFERTVYVKKFERFFKKKTRLHARLPENIDISVGDYIKIRECRPLSKLIHYIVIEKVRSASTEAKS